MGKKTDRVTAVLSLALISVVGAFTLFGRKLPEFVTENRKLAKAPALTMEKLYDGSTAEELNKYFTDHFAGRKTWITANTLMRTEIAESIVNGVYVSGDRLLDAELPQESVKSAASYADIFNGYANGYDGAVYFAVIPTSSGIYGDSLPSHLVGSPERQRINEFYDALGSDIRKIDAYNILKMLRENYIYYRNDTKWTAYGAYSVYKTVVQKLGFLPTPYDKYTIEHVTDKFRGNLYSRTLSDSAKADILDIYRYRDADENIVCEFTDSDGTVREGNILDKGRLGSGDMYSVYLGEKVPLVRIKTSVNNDRKLLVVKESYGDCFVPFLLQHYSEIAVVSPSAMRGELSGLVDINDYGQTLFLYGLEELCDENIKREEMRK